MKVEQLNWFQFLHPYRQHNRMRVYLFRERGDFSYFFGLAYEHQQIRQKVQLK